MKEIKTSKALNRAFLALKSFKRAKALLPFINLQTDENAKSALSEALSVAYGKPFTESQKIGSLKRDEVPVNHINTHDMIIRFRMKMAAHSDGNYTIQNEFMNCVYFIYDDKGLSVEENYPYPNESLQKEIENLLDEIISDLENIIKQCMSSGPPSTLELSNGKYRLNIEKGTNWFTRV